MRHDWGVTGWTSIRELASMSCTNYGHRQSPSSAEVGLAVGHQALRAELQPVSPALAVIYASHHQPRNHRSRRGFPGPAPDQLDQGIEVGIPGCLPINAHLGSKDRQICRGERSVGVTVPDLPAPPCGRGKGVRDFPVCSRASQNPRRSQFVQERPNRHGPFHS